MNNYVYISTYIYTHSIMVTYIYKAQYVAVQNVPVYDWFNKYFFLD